MVSEKASDKIQQFLKLKQNRNRRKSNIYIKC